MMKNKKMISLYILILSAFLIFSLIYSIGLGSVKISGEEILNILAFKIFKIESTVKASDIFIVWNMRMPRALTASLVGASLSLAGVGLQAVFKNPMAEPFVTGTSAGAALGATIALIFFKNSSIGLGMSAFIFALSSTLLIYSLAQSRGRVNISNLLLAGIVLSSLLNSFVSLLMIFNHKDLLSIITYTMGSFSGTSWDDLIILIPSLFVGFWILIYHREELNILAFGDESANAMGVEVEKTKKIILLCASLLTAITVSFTGIIPFVGLIVPHFFRLLIGSNHKYLLPLSFIGGAIFTLLCDNVARSMVADSEIPVGIITAIIGAPIFLYLLNKTKKV
jgi:iron complex transport system permease protein